MFWIKNLIGYRLGLGFGAVSVSFKVRRDLYLFENPGKRDTLFRVGVMSVSKLVLA